MKYLVALVVLVVLGMVVWAGVDVAPTPSPTSAPHALPDAPVRERAVADADVAAPVAIEREPPSPPLALPVDTARTAEPLSLGIPVQGKTANDLVDTFTDARSEGRSHDAIDIMAAAGTPVVAVADGYIEKLFTSDRGGLTIYQFEPSGRYAFYYAHLERYAPGLAEQHVIRRGEVIGYVGSTGNARPDAPHLHFAIFVLGPERQWWKGTAINPYPVLRAGAR